jgi:hypothetical protein
MLKETLYFAAHDKKSLPTQEYDVTKRYKMYYRELLGVDGEWVNWEEDPDYGSFDYIYAAYQARIMAAGLKDVVLNTLFYECDKYGYTCTI